MAESGAAPNGAGPNGAGPNGTGSRSVREEQLSVGFLPFDCPECAVTVLVRKSSPQQTSVQWQSSTTGCPRLAEGDDWRAGGLAPSCPDLIKAVHGAFERGALPLAPP